MFVFTPQIWSLIHTFSASPSPAYLRLIVASGSKPSDCPSSGQPTQTPEWAAGNVFTSQCVSGALRSDLGKATIPFHRKTPPTIYFSSYEPGWKSPDILVQRFRNSALVSTNTAENQRCDSKQQHWKLCSSMSNSGRKTASSTSLWSPDNPNIHFIEKIKTRPNKSPAETAFTASGKHRHATGVTSPTWLWWTRQHDAELLISCAGNKTNCWFVQNQHFILGLFSVIFSLAVIVHGSHTGVMFCRETACIRIWHISSLAHGLRSRLVPVSNGTPSQR